MGLDRAGADRIKLERRVDDNARRKTLPEPRPRGPNGERYCRRCGAELSGRRMAWCSDQCSLFARIEVGWQGAARQYLRERDGGVCAACGLDTQALAKWLYRLAGSRSRWRLPSFQDLVVFRRGDRALAAVRDLKRRGFDVPELSHRKALIRTLWHADHIVPIVEGGSLSPENLQTLCVPCHKADTAAIAARKAALRRQRQRRR